MPNGPRRSTRQPTRPTTVAKGMGENVFQGGFNALKSHFAGQTAGEEATMPLSLQTFRDGRAKPVPRSTEPARAISAAARWSCAPPMKAICRISTLRAHRPTPTCRRIDDFRRRSATSALR